MWRGVAAVAALLSSSQVASTQMEYVTLEPPDFDACMMGCDEAADQCFADDPLDENGIALCEETKTNCYRRCASWEAHRRAKETGHSLKCVIVADM